MKLFYLNPTYPNLELEENVLKGTGIELVRFRGSGDQDLAAVADQVDAILTDTTPIARQTVSYLKRCKIVVRLGVGYDIVDGAACREHGIVVCNVPDYGVEEVANHALTLLLAVHRRLLSYDRKVRQKKWGYEVEWPIRRLSHQRAGVIGIGRIGAHFAARVKPFVRDVVAYDPGLSNEQIQQRDAAPSDLPTLLETADLISLHLPLSEQTHHLINAETIGQMKRQPILVNVSRGGLIDSAALITGLREQKLSGAGLDVFEHEPDVPSGYLDLPNVILTPHVAWYSEESSQQLRTSAVRQVADFLAGKPPVNVVN
ncbi:MAG: C-terminal binding protein [Verrucomicrobia bacterium]|nr:C-terminal binding protein [Verrucomicrobiota bacterium]